MSRTGLAEDIRRWMETFHLRSMHAWMHLVKAAGLSMPQMGLLMFLHHGESRTVHDAGVHLGVSDPAASMLVDRLVRAGLAERREFPGDRRIRRITLSAAGRTFIERAMHERDAWVDDLAAHLSPAEESALRRVLPTLMEAERRLGEAAGPVRCATARCAPPPTRRDRPDAASKPSRAHPAP